MIQEQENGNRTAEHHPSIQIEIEDAMSQYGEGHRWESISLFSSEGLLMASHGNSPYYGQDAILEFSFSLIETVKLLRSGDVQEIIIKGRGHRTLVFRYFEAWGEILIIAAVIQGREWYRRALNNLIQKIQALNENA